jgi:hypothetical protein
MAWHLTFYNANTVSTPGTAFSDINPPSSPLNPDHQGGDWDWAPFWQDEEGGCIVFKSVMENFHLLPEKSEKDSHTRLLEVGSLQGDAGTNTLPSCSPAGHSSAISLHPAVPASFGYFPAIATKHLGSTQIGSLSYSLVFCTPTHLAFLPFSLTSMSTPFQRCDGFPDLVSYLFTRL